MSSMEFSSISVDTPFKVVSVKDRVFLKTGETTAIDTRSGHHMTFVPHAMCVPYYGPVAEDVEKYGCGKSSCDGMCSRCEENEVHQLLSMSDKYLVIAQRYTNMIESVEKNFDSTNKTTYLNHWRKEADKYRHTAVLLKELAALRTCSAGNEKIWDKLTT